MSKKYFFIKSLSLILLSCVSFPPQTAYGMKEDDNNQKSKFYYLGKVDDKDKENIRYLKNVVWTDSNAFPQQFLTQTKTLINRESRLRKVRKIPSNKNIVQFCFYGLYGDNKMEIFEELPNNNCEAVFYLSGNKSDNYLVNDKDGTTFISDNHINIQQTIFETISKKNKPNKNCKTVQIVQREQPAVESIETNLKYLLKLSEYFEGKLSDINECFIKNIQKQVQKVLTFKERCQMSANILKRKVKIFVGNQELEEKIKAFENYDFLLKLRINEKNKNSIKEENKKIDTALKINISEEEKKKIRDENRLEKKKKKEEREKNKIEMAKQHTKVKSMSIMERRENKKKNQSVKKTTNHFDTEIKNGAVEEKMNISLIELPDLKVVDSISCDFGGSEQLTYNNIEEELRSIHYDIEKKEDEINIPLLELSDLKEVDSVFCNLGGSEQLTYNNIEEELRSIHYDIEKKEDEINTPLLELPDRKEVNSNSCDLGYNEQLTHNDIGEGLISKRHALETKENLKEERENISLIELPDLNEVNCTSFNLGCSEQLFCHDIGEEFRNNSLARKVNEAFKEKGFEEIWLQIHTTNTPCKACLIGCCGHVHEEDGAIHSLFKKIKEELKVPVKLVVSYETYYDDGHDFFLPKAPTQKFPQPIISLVQVTKDTK